MKTVKAKITWLVEKDRIPTIIKKTERKIFKSYGPIIIFKGQYNAINPIENPNLSKWSSVIFNEKISNNQTLSTITFLVEDAPFNLLSIGAEFELYEGKNKVAFGIIIKE